MKDFTEIVNAQIAPLVEQIKIICLKNNIPFFVCVAKKDDEAITDYEMATSKEDVRKKLSSVYCADILTPVVSGTELSQDRITKMLCIMAGFDVIPPKQEIEVDF